MGPRPVLLTSTSSMARAGAACGRESSCSPRPGSQTSSRAIARRVRSSASASVLNVDQGARFYHHSRHAKDELVIACYRRSFRISIRYDRAAARPAPARTRRAGGPHLAAGGRRRAQKPVGPITWERGSPPLFDAWLDSPVRTGERAPADADHRVSGCRRASARRVCDGLERSNRIARRLWGMDYGRRTGGRWPRVPPPPPPLRFRFDFAAAGSPR
jgi:hypothetical protein